MSAGARTSSTVDMEALHAQIDHLCRVMTTHAGAIELVRVDEHGVVEVRFVGMCQGCALKPVTLYGSIVPVLLEVPGVTDVRAQGVCLSEATVERARKMLGSGLAATTEFFERTAGRN